MGEIQMNSVIELLQRAVPKGFYGEVSFVFQDGKVVLIREEKTTKLRDQNGRNDRSNSREQK